MTVFNLLPKEKNLIFLEALRMNQTFSLNVF